MEFRLFMNILAITGLSSISSYSCCCRPAGGGAELLAVVAAESGRLFGCDPALRSLLITKCTVRPSFRLCCFSFSLSFNIFPPNIRRTSSVETLNFLLATSRSSFTPASSSTSTTMLSMGVFNVSFITTFFWDSCALSAMIGKKSLVILMLLRCKEKIISYLVNLRNIQYINIFHLCGRLHSKAAVVILGLN